MADFNSSLPIRTETPGDVVVKVSDSTISSQQLKVNPDGSLNITDNGGSITVDGTVTVNSTDLDIRNLDHSQDSVKVGDGTDVLAVNPDGSINVVPLEEPGTERVSYNVCTAIGSNQTSVHELLLNNGGKLFQVLSSGSGRIKVEVQIETGAGTNTFNTIAVRFNSSSSPEADLTLSKYALVPVGAKVRVIRTNRENQAMDVYSTIVAIEN